MNKEVLSFINREINAVQIGDIILSRETTSSGYELIHISAAFNDELIYRFWNNPNETKGEPKHTGGKKPYIMLLTDEIKKLKKQGVANIEEMVGFIVCLGGNIEWGTGRLINKRSKKPLKYEDIKGIFSGGKWKLDRIISELKEHNLLYNTQEGYFISTDFIKKGKSTPGA